MLSDNMAAPSLKPYRLVDLSITTFSENQPSTDERIPDANGDADAEAIDVRMPCVRRTRSTDTKPLVPPAGALPHTHGRGETRLMTGSL
jgi:hypothetical protein